MRIRGLVALVQSPLVALLAALANPGRATGEGSRRDPRSALPPRRFAYVIDPKGVLRYVDRSVQVGSHGTDLLAILKMLKAS